MMQPNPAWLTTVERVLLAVFAALLVFHTLPKAWRTLNTDFPNYYLAATLAREHVDTSRMYEWRWLQREKDHREIDQSVIGLAPITPFSTLVVWPLTTLQPLPAKRVWIALQLLLLAAIVMALRRLTGQSLRRIVLLTVTCIPLHRNLLYGQLYILLLAILVAACLAYRERLSTVAGALIGLATMLKIFPAIFLLYFARKRDWRALLAGVAIIGVCTAISIHIFGWQVHRTYLQTILPWTLRGEAMPPYLLVSASISTLLHRLFVYEPQWNPHPLAFAPALLPVLGSLFSALILAPALLLSRASRASAPLEWAALLTATLTISTVPASYNFTLLLLPVVVLCQYLLPRQPLLTLAAFLLYIGIGYPGWNAAAADGWHAFAHVPRLWLLVLFTALAWWTLAKATPFAWNRDIRGWAMALGIIVALNIAVVIRRQRGMYDDYAYRVPVDSDALLTAAPASLDGRIRQIELSTQGYRISDASQTAPNQADSLSFAGDLTEEVTGTSRLTSLEGRQTIEDAHSPILSLNGQHIAYIRDRQGHGMLWQRTTSHDEALTPAWMNVEEATYLSSDTLLASAMKDKAPSALYLLIPGTEPKELSLGEARYPAASPDGRWIAYSRFDSGAWNLWLFDRISGQPTRLTHAPCNQTEPAWLPDSVTLLYASDCGRALGLTAICRRRVIPPAISKP